MDKIIAGLLIALFIALAVTIPIGLAQQREQNDLEEVKLQTYVGKTIRHIHKDGYRIVINFDTDDLILRGRKGVHLDN